MAEQNFADAVLTSTFYDKNWSSNNLMRSYQLEYADGSLEDRIDYSDWQLSSLVKRLKGFTPYPYNGIEKFTTIVNKFYGTTTVYRIVLMFNGFMHVYEIEKGTIIKMPYASDLSRLLEDLNKKKNTTKGGSVVI